MTMNVQPVRDALQNMDFKTLFNELGWDLPRNSKPLTIIAQNTSYTLREIAQLAGVMVCEVLPTGSMEKIPDAATRKAIHREVSNLYHENLLIFLNKGHTQSLWYWMKREGAHSIPREHLYTKGQPGDLSLGKLEAMVFDIGDQEQQAPDVLQVAQRLQLALDVERVTKRFYEDFKTQHDNFLKLIDGIDNDRDRRWYASVLLNRLMFIYFLQRKRFVDNGNINYLRDKLEQTIAEEGSDHYYSAFLRPLFFEGFAMPEEERSPVARRKLGNIRYLNGGLFLLHGIEERWQNIKIPDEAFDKVLKLFESYTWNLDDTPSGKDDELRPHVLGYIFEKYINQKSFGAYYTRPEITDYLCEHTIHTLLLERINRPGTWNFDSMQDLLMDLDAPLCRELLAILPTISILDPACGSGAFLVSALNALIKIYSSITGRIEYLNDTYLTKWLRNTRAGHESLNYAIKKKIITENLFGVDIMEEATEIAKLRLFITLVSSVERVDQLEPLPNIDFNILPGNSLIGHLRVNAERLSQLNLLEKSFTTLLEEKNRLIRVYKNTSTYTRDLRAMRNEIQAHRDSANATLNELLLDDFKKLGIKYEQATWNADKQAEDRAQKRAVTIQDISALHPFHWGYEFDQVMARGGFDIILTNPPWEALKPQDKELFADFSTLISKKKMRIEDFEKEKGKLLLDSEIRAAYLKYMSRFPYQSAYFRGVEQYANQISLVNGKKQGTDINLYKLFTEQCFNLLRPEGHCGIVIPSGIYTDLGAKQLREMLFQQTRITGLFGFENNKAIFEGVHRSFKFVVLTYEKGAQTQSFPVAFMRHEVKELERFPRAGALPMSVELIQRLSPDSFSLMELKNDLDVTIAQKMLAFPLLGAKLPDTWNFSLGNEFHMTNDSKLFRTEDGTGRLPLYEGKMIHQFTTYTFATHSLAKPRYWIDEKKGRQAILGREIDNSQHLGYQQYRLGHRSIARSTDARTMISTILPPQVFFGHSINATRNALGNQELLFITSMLNSFAVDFSLRGRVSANLTMFYIYQLPMPRLTEKDMVFRMIVERAAKLICTTPEYAKLWQDVMPDRTWSTTVVAIDPVERARLRAELDGLIAHLYNLTEEEFRYVLSTFPLVESAVKDAALAAYRDFALSPDNLALSELIKAGESKHVEFKVAFRWNARKGVSEDTMRDNVLQEVAAFLNSQNGGTVLIGVEDDGTIVGLAEDYIAVNRQKGNRDGYQLSLQNYLSDNLASHCSLYYDISFGTLQGKDICRIDVQPASEPVYTSSGDFYIREGNLKRKLPVQDAIDYIKRRWPSS